MKRPLDLRWDGMLLRSQGLWCGRLILVLGRVKDLDEIPEEGSAIYTIFYDLKVVSTEVELIEGFKNLLYIYKKL